MAHQRRLLSFLLGAMAAAAFVVIASVLVGYLGPSEKANSMRPYSEYDLDLIRAMAPGDHIENLGVDGYVVIFKPTADQWHELEQLSDVVFDPEITTYHVELGVFAVWSIGTSDAGACVLKHAPKGYFSHQPMWPGGYFDPCFDVSYDYAGRTIRDREYTAVNWGREADNLRGPDLSVYRGDTLRIRGRWWLPYEVTE